MFDGIVCSRIFCSAKWYSTSSLIFCAGSFLASYSLWNQIIIDILVDITLVKSHILDLLIEITLVKFHTLDIYLLI